MVPRRDSDLTGASNQRKDTRVNKRLCFVFAALAALPVFGTAQENAAAPSNPSSAGQKMIYSVVSGYVFAAAEKMPEENYSFKPTPDVRSFGQLVGHVADAQYIFCSTALSEQVSPKKIDSAKSSKADLVAALKDAVAYCSNAYAAMTDAKASQLVKFMNVDMTRLTVLSANSVHTMEHYGNMVTYMRLKGLVPPSTEKQK